MRITFIINTASIDALGELRTAVQSLRGQGHSVEAHVTFEGGDARHFARDATAAGTSLLIVAGGDGTVNEAVNGMHDHLAEQADRAAPPRLGIVPLGTGNDLATALEIPQLIPDAVHVAVNGTTMEFDVGQVNGHCFLNVSTGGFGAEATEDTPNEVKRTLGSLAYLITGMRKFATLEPSTARFIAAEPVYEGGFLLFAVGNSRRTGGGNWLTPNADPGDRLLDLCIVKEMPRVEFLGLLPELRSGNHLDHPAVVYRQLPALTVEADTPLSVNADGEPIHGRRFRYDISPHRLLLMRPR